MILNCIIVDDEPTARKILEEYITSVDFLRLKGQAEHPLKASELLLQERADLMFLDINMPKMSGIEFLKTAPHLPLTILTTAYTEYAVQGFELDVIDYLVKPFSEERFLKACTRALEYLELAQGNSKPDRPAAGYFFVKSDGKIEKIQYEELVYAEAMQNYVVLHTEDRKLIVYLTLKGIMEQLPAATFLKVHKSTIVNLDKVRHIDGNRIDLGKARVSISQGQYSTVMKAILKDRMLKR